MKKLFYLFALTLVAFTACNEDYDYSTQSQPNYKYFDNAPSYAVVPMDSAAYVAMGTTDWSRKIHLEATGGMDYDRTGYKCSLDSSTVTDDESGTSTSIHFVKVTGNSDFLREIFTTGNWAVLRYDSINIEGVTETPLLNAPTTQSEPYYLYKFVQGRKYAGYEYISSEKWTGQPESFRFTNKDGKTPREVYNSAPTYICGVKTLNCTGFTFRYCRKKLRDQGYYLAGDLNKGCRLCGMYTYIGIKVTTDKSKALNLHFGRDKDACIYVEGEYNHCLLKSKYVYLAGSAHGSSDLSSGAPSAEKTYVYYTRCSETNETPQNASAMYIGMPYSYPASTATCYNMRSFVWGSGIAQGLIIDKF